MPPIRTSTVRTLSLPELTASLNELRLAVEVLGEHKP